jgi:Lysylphosphatidylglycerol synthase TM region
VARLAGAIPITPGGLGTLDAAFISMLVTFGASSSQALTADLIWRLTTYFLPILSGTVTYLVWMRWHGRSLLLQNSAPAGLPVAVAGISEPAPPAAF